MNSRTLTHTAGILAIAASHILFAGAAQALVLFRDDFTDTDATTLNQTVENNNSISGTVIAGMAPSSGTYRLHDGGTSESGGFGYLLANARALAFVNYDFHNSADILARQQFTLTLENLSVAKGANADSWTSLGVFDDAAYTWPRILSPNLGLGILLRPDGSLVVNSKGTTVASAAGVPNQNATLAIEITNITFGASGSFDYRVLVNDTSYANGSIANVNTSRNNIWAQTYRYTTTMGAWEISINSEPGPPTIVPPTNPANGASGVLVSSDFTATFNENIALTGTGTVTIRDLGPGPDVVIDLSGPDPDGSVAVTGRVLTISPASNLVAGNPYAIQISADAIEDFDDPPSAFAGILDDTTWSFQTAADGTPPTMVSTDPADDATGVAVNTNLVATFDEPITAASGNITIRNLIKGTETVIPVGDARIAISGTDLTINPTTDLDPDADYAIRIDAGALTDTTGNPFAGITDDTTWNFTTLPDTTHPTLVLPTIPADGAINVTTTSLVATFSEPIMATAPTVLHDWDFDTDGGGFTLKSGGSGTEWVHGTPDSVGEFGGSVTADNSGSGQCWATGLGDFTNDPTLTGRGYYADPTTTCLRSPVIDLRNVTSAQLTFSEALDVEAGDTAVVRLIDDTSDTVIATLYTAVDGSTSAAAWAAANGAAAIDLAAGIGQMVRLEWCLGDPATAGATNDYLGWYIDDVQVTATAAANSITIKNLTESTARSIAVSDSSQVSISGNVLTITPNPLLDTESEYAILIGASALTDLYGNPFAGISDETTWNFTTGTAIWLPVAEHSFEGAKALGGWAPPANSAAGPGKSTVLVPAPWVKTGGGFGSAWTVASQYSGGIPDGDIYAYANGGTHIRQTLAATLQADTTYTLTVAVGWRKDLPGFGYPNFPGYGIELWAGGVKLASTYGAGHSGAGTPAGDQWKDAVATFTSPSSVTPDPLEIRLIGYAIQTNYDNVRLTAQPATGSGDAFTTWIALYEVGGLTGLGDDPDGDGIPNGVENFFGTEPDAFSQGLVAQAYGAGAGTFTFTHPQGTLAGDLTAAYQWSKDLATFHADGGTDGDGTRVDFTVAPDTPSLGTTTVTATVTGVATAKLFVRVQVTQD